MRQALVMMMMWFPCCCTAAAESTRLSWAWAGGVTEQSAVVIGRATAPVRLVVIEEQQWSTLRLAATAAAVRGDADGIVRTAAQGLKPDTVYAYGDSESATPTGTFRTMPVPGKPANFVFALGSCMSDANAPTFYAIAKQNPLFMLITGDLHYEGISDNDPKRFFQAITSRPSTAAFAAMTRAMPLVYIWDDHDFCGNDSDGKAPGAPAAHASYRRLFPSHALAIPGAVTPIAQAFSVGRVRFIMPDLRSQRDVVPDSLLGAAQKIWIDQELQAAKQHHALIVLVSSVPWNGEAKSGTDRWQSYAAERTWLAGRIKASGVRACILSGDAHMCAIDNGANPAFAPGWPIPVFQAAALSRPGSYKGGPYSEGARSGSRQFGLMQVSDDGTQLTVHWEARDGSDGDGNTTIKSKRDNRIGEPLVYTFQVRTEP